MPGRGRGRPRKRQRDKPAQTERLRASSPPPKKRRKQWTDEAMVAAMEAVKDGAAVKRAAIDYGVPRSTLQDRISGRVVHGINPGPKPYLTKREEARLSEFLQAVGQVGYPKTRRDVKGIAQAVATEKGVLKRSRISDGWFRKFMERQPHLSLRKGDATAKVRMDVMAKQEELNNYFKILKDVLDKNKLTDKPGSIYNVDESGVPLDPRPPHVVTARGQRKVRYTSSGNKSQVTVVGSVSATGQALPPFVIFDAKGLNMEWTKGEVPGTTYGLSGKGWMDMELFKLWFREHFLKHAVGARPLLLLLDGHSSHYNPETIRLARENDVIMFTLVPHTTHEMQPLDKAVFGPLKVNWRNACHDFLHSNPSKVINKYNFSPLLNEAWMKTMQPQTIVNGFRSCGVYPFNPRAVLDHDLPDDTCEPVTEETQQPESIPEPPPHFTTEEERLFQKRYEEGYNIFVDQRYVEWLKLNHPEVDVQKCSDLENTCTTGSDSPSHDGAVGSIADCFSHVDPLDPIDPDTSQGDLPDAEPPTQVCFTPQYESPETTLAVTKGGSSAVMSRTPLSSLTNMSAKVTPGTKRSPQALGPDILSKYLVQYVPEPPKPNKKPSSSRVFGQRVLTSDQGYKVLADKETKKQEDMLEKERKKAERLENKKRKEEEKVRKAEERKAKNVTKKPASKKCHTPESGSGSGSSSSEAETTQESSNVCCECLLTYEQDVAEGTGAEWVRCVCGSWLHEECIAHIEYDENGDEKLCSSCTSVP